MKEYTDQEIIECLRTRQSYVIHYLSDRYLPMIRLMIYGMGGTGEDAKDIFQDALIIILSKIDNNELVLTCKFKVFLYSICQNLWRVILKKRKAASNYLIRSREDSGERDFTEIYDNALYENMFYDMFETLEPLCKKILKLYWQEYTPREIARKLKYKYGYIKKKKCECQGVLVSRVKNHPGYKSLILSEEKVKTVVFE